MSKRKGISVILLVFLLVCVTGSLLIGAASSVSQTMFWYSSEREVGEVPQLHAGFEEGKMFYAMIDGHSAYCLNYTLFADGGQTMTSSTDSRTELTDEQRQLLAYCLYYGFSTTSTENPSVTDRDQHLATQAMVWIIVGDIFDTEDGDAAAQIICDSAPDPAEAYDYYANLRAQIHGAYYAGIPSFASENENAAAVSMLSWNKGTKRYETTLTDANEKIQEFGIDLPGFQVERKGNSITISTATPTVTTTGRLSSNRNFVKTTSSCVFWLTGRDGDQEFISERPAVELKNAYMKVETGRRKASITLFKTDASTGQVCSGEGLSVAGAEYGLYAAEEIHSDTGVSYQKDGLVCTLKIGEDGTAKIGNLWPGRYYLKETNAPAGYVLDLKKHEVDLSESASAEEEIHADVIVQDEAIQKSIRIHKTDRDGAPLSGVGFSVFREDSSEAEVIGENGETVLFTDAEGYLTTIPLRPGTYRIREVVKPDNYIACEDQYCVVKADSQGAAQQNDSTQKIGVAQQSDVAPVQVEFVNDPFKARVKVKKVDERTGNLIQEPAWFRIEDAVSGAVSGTTENGYETKNGELEFPFALKAGTYRLVEVIAPFRYEIADPIEFTIDEKEYETASIDVGQEPVLTLSVREKEKRCALDVRKLDDETGVLLDGARFALIAAEDIPCADGSVEEVLLEDDGAPDGCYTDEGASEPGTRRMEFSKGQTVAVQTSVNGVAHFDHLPIGGYYVREVLAPDGYEPELEDKKVSLKESETMTVDWKNHKKTEPTTTQPVTKSAPTTQPPETPKTHPTKPKADPPETPKTPPAPYKIVGAPLTGDAMARTAIGLICMLVAAVLSWYFAGGIHKNNR